MASLMVGVALGLTFVAVLLCMRSSFHLLEGVYRHAPETWQRLGRPEKVWVDDGDGGIRTIKPLWPWLVWVWNAGEEAIADRLEPELARARRLLRLALGSLLISIAAFFYLAASAAS